MKLKIFKGEINESLINEFIEDKNVISTNVVADVEYEGDIQVFVWYEEMTSFDKVFKGLSGE